MTEITVEHVQYADHVDGRTEWVAPAFPRAQRDCLIRAIVSSRRIPLDVAFEAIREHARSEQMSIRIGACYPDEGEQTVSSRVGALLAELAEIRAHVCDFGADRDSICGTCGTDPRS